MALDDIPWDVILTVLGVVVPVGAALYEFILVGRKRLGYRIQMDTTATDTVHSQHAGALQELQQGNTRLVDPSFVLLRIENNGATNIDPNDYSVLDDDKVGIRVNFPGRRVAGVVVTELSHDFLRPSFAEGLGLGVRDGVIELPKVPLNRATHYKVLAALERIPTDNGGRREGEEFETPQVIGGIKGGVGSGGIQETKNRTGPPLQAVSLVCFLMLVIIAQFTVSITRDEAAALDCAKGELTLIGSTAFQPVLEDAVTAYKKTCPETVFHIETEGSGRGVRRLDTEGSKDPGLLAFSDGSVSDGYPMLVRRPIAFSLFSLVANKQAGVSNLNKEQIEQIFAGQIPKWDDDSVDGGNQPVRLVDREAGSGTRNAFEERVLGGNSTAGENSEDCETLKGGKYKGVIRCRRGTTKEVLDTVATTDGAIGYSEIGLALARKDLVRVTIDGHPATLKEADQGAYPFWETEYAYTYGEVEADSLTASFLRYLTNEVGKDIVRSHGHRPCDELEKPVICQPVAEPEPTASAS